MRAAITAAALLSALVLSGGVQAQQPGALCRGFCDVDAKACRKEAAQRADSEVDPLDPNDFRLHSQPRQPHDDFTDQKKLAVANAAEKTRFAAAGKCSATRQACVQRCAPPEPAAASAP